MYLSVLYVIIFKKVTGKKKMKNSMSLVQGGLGKADFPLSLCDVVSRCMVPGERALT